MKKIVLAFVALFAVTTFASELSLDVRAGYARSQGGANGMVVGPGVYYSLMKSDGFLQDVAIGGSLDFTYFQGGAMGILVGPELKACMPYSYFKLGFGYQYSRAGGVGNNALGMKFGVAGLYPIGDGMKIGLDFTFGYKLTSGRAWNIQIGPVFSMNL